MKLGLICKPNDEKALALAKMVFDFLEENKVEIFHEEKLSERLEKRGYTFDEINKKSDIVVTIGGDGTILRALEKIEKPIFAINSGGMGFLTEVESKYAISGLKKILSGEYNIEERIKLKVIFDGKRLVDATNEITIQTARIAKLIEFQVLVEEERMEVVKADGIIIATPTGSTSYALSAGGPIVDPSVDAVVVVPLAAFKLSARPWIIPSEKKICVKLLPGSKDAKLVIDGKESHKITPKNEVCVTKSEKKARFIRFGESFYQMVRLKLIR
jgi:NAD+ kinase